MAQIIKQRRGSITQLKDVTARISELVVATGSIGNLNGPFLFVGETEGVAGAYRPISKIYQGAAAPTITVGSYGSVLDGTPFYASGNKSLYILSQAGNSRVDLTGNIEGNTISNVTITSLTGSNANYTNLTGETFTSTNSNITSLTSSNAFVTNLTGGTLTVTGITNLGGDLNISGNIIQTGSIDLTGNIALGGNITIGNQTTDIIQFGGEVSSSILPIVHNAFDLGSSEKNWRNLHVSGTAYIDTLEAKQVNLTDLGVLEDLTVSGNTYLGNGGDITVISGSLYNDQLTQKRMVVVGVDGLLTDYSGLTFDNGNLNLSGALEVTNIQGTGSLYLKPDLNDGRDFRIYNTAPSDIHIKGNASYNFFGDDTNYLKIDDSSQTVTIVGVNGVFVSSSLNVTGSAQFSSTINVDGEATLSSATVEDLTQDRIVAVGAGGSLIDYSGLTYNGTEFKIGGDQFKVDNSNGNVSTSGSLTVGGSTTLKSTSQLQGAVGMNSTLDVTGSVTLKDSLSVSSTASFSNDVNLISGNTLYVNSISDYGNNDLLVSTYGDLTLESTQSLNIQLRSANDELGVNYINVNSGSVNFSTYDTVSGLTHKVLLDNTGSLRFENVAIGITGSLGISGSLDVKDDAIIHGNLYVSGNLELLGSSSYVNISSSQVDLGTNIINLNTYAPFERFGGITVHDSGSSAGATGSLLWDAINNVWIYSNPSGSSYASARFIAGPKNTGSLGDETGLTVGHFPIAVGDDHIADSLLTYLGTTLAFNTNKFTIDSGTGDTMVSGNFTLSYSGGTDTNTKTSAIMFRNSNNVVGFVSTTETTDVLDGLLGYKNSNGGLVFSTVIDGGTY